MESEPILNEIQSCQIDAASRSRQTEQVGPFRVMLTPADDLTFFNYAVPTQPNFSAQSIDVLKSYFESKERAPRLEVIDQLWPALRLLLVDAGFAHDPPVAVMACGPNEFIAKLAEADTSVLSAEDDFSAFTDVANAAYDSPGALGQGWVDRNRPKIAQGRLELGIARLGGSPVSCAALQREGALAELASVGTIDAHRRKGLATGVACHLLSRFFATNGRLAWLTAENDKEEFLYRRIGFRTIGSQSVYHL